MTGTTVTIDQGDIDLEVGDSVSLTATVTAADGADTEVTWASSNVSVATVSAAGVVQAVAVGVTTVTAASTFDPRASDSLEITVTPAANPSASALWTHQFGTNGLEQVNGVAVDSQGNIIVVGYTYGVLGDSGAGGMDAFVTKVDGDGLHQWTHQFGTGRSDQANAVAVDSEDNIIVAGTTQGVLKDSNAGSHDAFVTKVDGDGLHLWTHQFGTRDSDTVLGIAVDSNDDIVMVGHTRGDLESSNLGSEDAFVSKVDGSGLHLWTYQFGTSEGDTANGVAVDPDDSVIIVGSTGGALGDSPSAGNQDGFVIKIDNDGIPLWTHQFGTMAYDVAYAVAVDSDGSFIIAGRTNGALGDSSAGDWDGFVLKVDGGGIPDWTQQFGTSGSDYANGVAVDSAGAILIAGYTTDILGDSSAGGRDAYVRKIDSGGTLVWTHQFGTSEHELASGVAVDSQDNVIVVGRTYGVLGDSSAGGPDAFVRKYLP